MKLFLVLVLLVAASPAQTRRAVLVGIDEYSPGPTPASATPRTRAIQGTPSRKSLEPLAGAQRDAEAMKQLLVERFGFEDRNVILLTGQAAKADAILTALETHLIANAARGDISLFYFAGHGSRIRNRAIRNANIDGWDSTILPADSLQGAPDIRGKELARIFSRAPRKGVHLTVIHDSCYSGAAARGPVAARRVRAQPPDGGVWIDEVYEGRLPEDDGVLLLSAAQDDQPAAELDATDLGGSHGAFTWALLRVLAVTPPNERVDRIFQRVRALMQSEVAGQEPVMLAKQGRNEQSLLGEPASTDAKAMTVAVRRITDETIRLNGGAAMNLHEGCELRRITPGRSPAMIRVTKVSGVSTSEAAALSGPDDAIEAGDLFELAKWVVPEQALLRVYWGEPAPEIEQAAAANLAATLRRSRHWVDDPTVRTPTHILSWAGGRWKVQPNQTGAEPVWLDHLTRDAMPKTPDARLYLLAPPTPAIAQSLRAIPRADSPEHADYALISRFHENHFEYAWAVPNSPAAATLPRPARTQWDAGPALPGAAQTLARINGWLKLASPAEWPYDLTLSNAATGKLLAGNTVTGGEKYQFLLRAARPLEGIRPRRIYIFGVDSFGASTLIFGDNLQNTFPRGDAAPAQIPLPVHIEITPPYGTDTYYLLSTETPIDNPRAVFDSAGVRTRAAASSDPLTHLLSETATGTRSGSAAMSPRWSIQRLTLISRAPGRP